MNSRTKKISDTNEINHEEFELMKENQRQLYNKFEQVIDEIHDMNEKINIIGKMSVYGNLNRPKDKNNNETLLGDTLPFS